MSIIDGNTFTMSVQFEDDKPSSDKYTEEVKIYGLDTPSISTLSGILAKLELEKIIVGRRVECEILKRHKSGFLIANLPKRYLIPSFPFDPGIEL